ncbi:hypothetical protein LUZ61_017720 [Rhynchospora tenuis]|uniref:DUF4220 domain-containing protein n=1 Tax=Rhynchospora tenuis TaxID=198213 RepID=A0AAD5Z828_9POAL|nr:hypothetical protein LUZ61_017720 [Rhynchospora tenuis]
MDEHQKYSCTSELGAEVLLVFISSVIATFSLYLLTPEIAFVSQGTKFRKLSAKEADIFLSSAFALFLPLMSYLFSQAKQHNSEGRAQLILVWMVLIEFIRVRSGGSAWELKKSLEQLVRLLWVAYLIYSYTRLDGLRTSLFILCVYAFTYEVLKGIAFNKAKDSYLIGKNPKIVQNYMKRVMHEGDLRTMPMSNCAYIVMGEENHDISISEDGYRIGDKKPDHSEGLLTIGRVFQLNTPEDKAFTKKNPYWRDSCLSFALAKMLRRRFVNLPLDEAGNNKALEFVLEGLIGYIGSNKDVQNEESKARNPSQRVPAPLVKWIRRRAFSNVLHSTDVKEAILRSLRNSGGQLPNAETSLSSHRIFENLSRDYQPSSSNTETILVWHIATTLFNHEKPPPHCYNTLFKLDTDLLLRNDDPFKKEREVALALSDYCHYLVATLPQLLPDEVDSTKKLYERVRREIFAIDRCSGLKPIMENRCEYVMDDIRRDENLVVVGKGAKLAKELVLVFDDVDENRTKVWTMLSEFWVKMVLSIAPSDNVKGHEEILEKKELITQLWALLTHAGILTRPKPTQHISHGTHTNEGSEIATANHGIETNESPEVAISSHGMRIYEGPEIRIE